MRRWLFAIPLLLCATTAQAEWFRATSDHFVVYSDANKGEVAAYTERLERFDKAMKALWNIKAVDRGPAARVTVFTLSSINDIHKLFGAGGGNVAGFYHPRAGGSVAFVPRSTGGTGRPWEIDAQRVLLHEYAHHFMFSDWPAGIVPLWFTEGFAEYHSTAIFNQDGSVTFGAPPTDRLFGVADQNAMPLGKMINPKLGELDGRQTYGLYSRGWALLHYMINDPERRQQLGAYLAAVNAGKPLDEAAKPFGSINALDFKLVSYVKNPRFQSQLVPANRIDVGKVTVQALTAGEAATMAARIRSARGVDEKSAGEIAALARTQAAPFPNDPGAQNVLAEADYDAKDYPGALAAADRALAADPKSVHALLYRGQALQAQATAAKSHDAAQWREVRRWYIAANKAEPENPEPLILYYRSFEAAGEPATKSAADGIIYAQVLAPYDTSLNGEVAQIRLQRGEVAQARLALEPLAYAPHGGEASEKMRGVLDVLDTQGAAAARTALDKLVAENKAKAEKKAAGDTGKKGAADS